MVQIIQRKSDNKYLQSAETDTWVDDSSEAFEMSLIEYIRVKNLLSTSYSDNDLKIIINGNKFKNISKEDKKETQNLFKK